MIKLNALMTGLLLLSMQAIAQIDITEQPSLTKVTPPSPNASSLGKFGDVPVSMATGIPQINVPIYNFKNFENSLSLDVTLDYHAGGVRVNEMASDVGIGWTLNAGGAITRTLRGIADEIPTYGFMNNPLITEEKAGNRFNTGYYYPNYFYRIANDQYDGQNDIFSFNFAGKSGRFLFGKNGDFLMLTSNKLKVQTEISEGKIARFTIVDESGTTYVFDAVEESDNGTIENFHLHNSAWYMTKMIAPSRTDSIMFSYEQEWSRYTPGEFVTMSYSLGLQLGIPSRAEQTSYSTVITNGKRLKSIIFPNDVKMNFMYDANRRADQETNSSMNRLQQISFTDGVYTRGYNLYHDYSVNRLTLKKVIPYSASGEGAGYEFSYNGSLPEFLSNSLDHWGFYNTNANGSLLPPYKDNTGLMLSGGNRSTDPTLVKMGSLTRIKFPTGGYTEFEMEANTAEDPRLIDSTLTIVREKSYERGIYVSNNGAATESFKFGGDAGSNGEFNVQVFQNGSCTGLSPCNFLVQLRNSFNQVIYTLPIPGDNSFQYKNYSFTVSNMQPGNYSWNVYVQNMEYSGYITMSWIEVHNQHPDTIKTVVKDLYIGGIRIKSIKDYDGISSSPVSARNYEYLKSNSTESSGSLGVIPKYAYPVYYDFYPHDHIKGETFPDTLRYEDNGIGNYIVRASSPTQSLASINGSPVTYSRVVEYYTNNGVSNGKKECYFTSYLSGGLEGYNPLPYTPPTYVDWSYGQLEKEIVYNKANDTVRKTSNQYQNYTDTYYYNTNRLNNFTCLALAPVVYQYNATYQFFFTSWNQAEKPLYYKVRTFTPAAGRRDLIKTTVSEYRNSIILTDEKSYTYDTAFNVKTITQYNSKGEKVEIVKYFPYEYTVSTAATMKSQNMYDADISTEIWKTIGSSKYLVNGTTNQYIITPSGIRKAKVASFTSSTPVASTALGTFKAASFNRDSTIFKDFLTFNQYSAKGNLLEQSKVKGMSHAYIYGHNASFLIAEVMNATSADVAFSSFEESGKGNWTYTGVPATNPTAISGAKLYVLSGGSISKAGLSSAKTYKVSYWSRSSPATISGSTVTQGASRNGWTYFEHTLPGGATSVNIQGNVTIDDLRLYPAGASMTTFTYQPLYGITSVADSKSQYTYYVYDDFGRLKVIKDQDGMILKQFDYQYQTSISK
ncbi:hypothetical protein [Chitinophaga rhizophila]|uniref:YD repeat-containing protein n=1 Tax=Chitinophaga rhizophila TaxID=2866212 RepID=A0ABS7G894_9BACT|nr:hypothetical protein [Chitinophaga rhizophila]MBW8683892.1 hypothetical protein [Chitinophaga rhizophila]